MKNLEYTSDRVNVVRCIECVHRPIKEDGDIRPPKIDKIYDDLECPYLCEDGYYSKMPLDNGFCHNGEKK